jgi:hypothetical protein
MKVRARKVARFADIESAAEMTRNEEPQEAARVGAEQFLMASRHYAMLLVVFQVLVDVTFLALATGALLVNDHVMVGRFVGGAMLPFLVGAIVLERAFPRSVRRSQEWTLALWRPRICRAAFVGIGAPEWPLKLRLAANLLAVAMLVASLVRA